MHYFQYLIDKSLDSNEQVIERLVQAASKLTTNNEANLNIVEKMINDIHKNMLNQLVGMVNATSNHVVESNLIDNTKLLINYASYKSSNRQYIENNPKFLCQLIDLTFEQFKAVAKYYRHFIEYAAKVNATKYSASVIWTCIQNVLVQLLDEYLDIKQLGQQSLMTQSDIVDRLDINSFFARKRLINLSFATNNE